MSSAEDAYAREQSKLRQRGPVVSSDVEEDDDDLHIDVPQGLPEVNPEIFRDVEPLLFKGFVYAPAVINEVSFVFKSLNHHEFELLHMMGGVQPDNPQKAHKAVQQQFNLFLAFGVLFLDGNNILQNREANLLPIAKMFGDLNETARRKVIFQLSEINRRANRAVILTEAFCMEPQSRLRWAQFKGENLMTPNVTGFPGTENLGLNWGQLVWRALNNFEDRRDLAEREWENAKFVASSMAGKGMTKVYSQDRLRRKQEREERIERRDKILRFALLNEAPNKPGGNAQVTVARTVEELASQLERDLKGEKDWHDMVVDRYEQRNRASHQARMQVIHERHAAHQAEYGPRGIVGGTEKGAGLTQDEVRFRLDRRRQLAAQRLAAQASAPELHDPKMIQFLDKWAGTNQSGDTQPLGPAIADKTRALPFKRGDR